MIAQAAPPDRLHDWGYLSSVFELFAVGVGPQNHCQVLQCNRSAVEEGNSITTEQQRD